MYIIVSRAFHGDTLSTFILQQYILWILSCLRKQQALLSYHFHQKEFPKRRALWASENSNVFLNSILFGLVKYYGSYSSYRLADVLSLSFLLNFSSRRLLFNISNPENSRIFFILFGRRHLRLLGVGLMKSTVILVYYLLFLVFLVVIVRYYKFSIASCFQMLVQLKNGIQLSLSVCFPVTGYSRFMASNMC